MPNKMLIDASHPEETRVVVVRGNRIEEFDFESQDKKQLKGNIYLARVTRVEPSLQAAFVEYGGNRHGFLAFSEIHPDYYQIPVADRQALLRAEQEAAQAEDEEEDEERSGRGRRRRRAGRGRADRGGFQAEAADAETAAAAGNDAATETSDDVAGAAAEAAPTFAERGEVDVSDDPKEESPAAMAHDAAADVIAEDLAVNGELEEVNGSGSEPGEVESVGADDAVEEVRRARRFPRRQYKIQEVIKRRQILLVQVVKEERGNKGAALTTYLSLAGRYSVLMPNTARGGGISRKITNAQDRKRLKDVVRELDVPEGMGVILRTAGESRTKAEIKRDYEYLMRLWENVRTLTLSSIAPALVYEEGSLIKRSVRDLYNKDIDEVLVAGEEGYREAKDFMRMLMPSHAKVVQPYRDNIPLFVRYGVESQLDKMLQPQVTLKSGGYIIINQTEALVSIDVNSGRSTKEHSIEDTALQTNLEAAEEIARQLRLRDLAGLIVIDFIDMEENRNNRAVEKRLKECLKNDRARIQVGRISHFGLLEMSRQRIRASVLESTMQPCPHCGGTGHVRSDSSVALLVLRAIEEYLLKDNRFHITVRTPAATALYVLNHKRANLTDLERRFGLTITIEVDEAVGSQHYAIFKGAPVDRSVQPAPPVIEPPALEMDDEIDEVDMAEAEQPVEARPASDEDGEHHRKRRRRRRRRGGRDHRETGPTEAVEAIQHDVGETSEPELAEGEAHEPANGEAPQDGGHAKRRRRGKRGGRRNRRQDETQAGSFADQEGGAFDEPSDDEAQLVATESEAQPAAVVEREASDAEGELPTIAEPTEAAQSVEIAAEPVSAAPEKPARRSRKKAVAADTAPADEAAPAPSRRSRAKAGASAQRESAAAAEEQPAPAGEAAADTSSEPVEDEAAKSASKAPAEPVVTVVSGGAPEPTEERPRKQGWWQRKGFF